MISMTGFAHRELRNEDVAIEVEVKSYNNRYLDIKHNIPNLFSPYEQEIDKRIKHVALRGSVEITIRYKQFTHTSELIVNEEMVKEYKKAFDTIATLASIEKGAEIRDYAMLDGVFTLTNTLEIESLYTPLFSLLDDALLEFKGVKEKEGEATYHHIAHLLNEMKKGVDTIKSYSSSIEMRLKENLLKKIEEVMGEKEYDEGRFLTEVALLLVKYSIEEELQRLNSHFIAFEETMRTQGSVGKKLDFLCQEFHREINTIGSKSTISEVNQVVVSLKDNVENIREQLRNIE